MKVYRVLIAVLCVSVTLANPLEKVLFRDAQSSEGRIAGGSLAKRREFPYLISLHANGQHECGGSILTQRWVLTAAHCIDGPVSGMKVYAGMLNQRENHPDVQVSGVRQNITHPQYQGGINPHDIALLELANPLTFKDAVQPISLPQQGQEFSGQATVSGWGLLSSSDPTLPTELRKVELDLWSHNDCASKLDRWGISNLLDNSMQCCGGPSGKESPCSSDSGGPAVHDGVLIGVASWGLIPCGSEPDAPSVFTKVSFYINWIGEYVR